MSKSFSKKKFCRTAVIFTFVIFSASNLFAFDLLKNLGKELGIDKKTLNIIDKGIKVVKSLAPIGYEEEKALGGAIAVEVFSTFGGRYNDDSLLRYVTLVGRSVAQLSDRPDIEYYFAIINNHEPNAFAAPGGYIFITIGLLKKIKNEAELAGVLGHEIAHIVHKHALSTIQRSKRLQGLSELSLAAMDKDPKLFAGIINEVTKKLFEEGLDQNLEYEADKSGVEFAYRTGYNPDGLTSFLKTLQAIHGREESVFFKTHPSTSERIKRLEKNILPAYKEFSSLPLIAQRYRRITGY